MAVWSLADAFFGDNQGKGNVLQRALRRKDVYYSGLPEGYPDPSFVNILDTLRNFQVRCCNECAQLSRRHTITVAKFANPGTLWGMYCVYDCMAACVYIH